MEYLDKCLVRSERLVWRMIDGQAFLLNEDGKKMHMLNKAGSMIWQYAKGDVTVQEIIGRIVERFDVDKETAHRDASEFIEKLLNLKMIDYCEKGKLNTGEDR